MDNSHKNNDKKGEVEVLFIFSGVQKNLRPLPWDRREIQMFMEGLCLGARRCTFGLSTVWLCMRA